MRVRKLRMTIVLVILLAVALPALANAGTALLHLSVLHLLFGNLLIGILEALVAQWVLSNWYGVEARLMGWMILANYVSMLAGLFGLGYLVYRIEAVVLGQHPVANLPWLIVAVLLASFLVTVFIEWFFLYIGVLRTDPPPVSGLRGISFRVNLITQLASYAILIPLYLSASGMSLVTGVERERNLHFVKTPQAEVYYRSLDGRELRRVRLDGSPAEPVNDQGPFLKAVKACYGDDGRILNQHDLREAFDLRPPAQRDIEVTLGFWPIDGLRIGRTGHDEQKHLALDMPFFLWHPISATILPGDQVVYQVHNYLVIYDLHTRQITDLGPGREPVVIIPGVKLQPSKEQ